MDTASYIQSMSVILPWDLCTLGLYLTFHLWPSFNLKFLSGHNSEAIKGNYSIFSGYINLPLDLCNAQLVWPFDIDITITLNILSGSLLGNYKWQLLYIFSACQTNMGLSHCHFYLFDLCPSNYDLWQGEHWSMIKSVFSTL